MENYQSKPAEFDLTLPGLSKIKQQIFCLPGLNIEMPLDNIDQTLSRLREDGVPISPSVPDYINDKVSIFGILGNDIIQHFDVLELKSVEDIKMIRIYNGFVPYGSVNKL